MPVSRVQAPWRPAPSRRARQLKIIALVVCILLAILGALLGLRSPMLHQYEYQEDLYVSLDGSASVYVSGSLPVLAARLEGQAGLAQVRAGDYPGAAGSGLGA